MTIPPTMTNSMAVFFLKTLCEEEWFFVSLKDLLPLFILGKIKKNFRLAFFLVFKASFEIQR